MVMERIDLSLPHCCIVIMSFHLCANLGAVFNIVGSASQKVGPALPNFGLVLPKHRGNEHLIEAPHTLTLTCTIAVENRDHEYLVSKYNVISDTPRVLERAHDPHPFVYLETPIIPTTLSLQHPSWLEKKTQTSLNPAQHNSAPMPAQTNGSPKQSSAATFPKPT